LGIQPGTWRLLLSDVRRVEVDVLAHADQPIDSLMHELGIDRPPFEVIFDGTGHGGLAGDAVLSVSIGSVGDRQHLVLRYRTEVIDADCASRIAGYHLTALRLMSSAPDAPHHTQSLLSREELELQIDGLAGLARPRPERRVHELFEEQVRMRPDDVAALHGESRLTYRELNARANRVARALLDQGLRREGVVAVVTERDLDWMVAVLGIFKAGGVYLPIEPHFPAGRIATMLSRAECDIVLTEQDSTRSLDEALGSLNGVSRLFVTSAWQQAGESCDLGLTVAADQLAYIYFTSGSTGEPKGAMCEHAGMLNHLCAKIEDLEISSGQVVAQTAPQCFDISLWQLLAGVLVGGRTLLVEQQTILDVERFVDKIVAAEVAVLQVVPSYLEAVLTYLQRHPRTLPDLRYVSVTGEALKRDLAERWFAAQPDIGLVNAYGLTETSDDTNHEVMTRAPAGERVPLGRPIPNVRIYVVDDNLCPVPLGAPGTIVFSGICVGRGYVNDPERSAHAYLADPHRPGARLYQGGDVGRWLPDGKLEFLGRVDAQVKIRGFRIEIEEVENFVLRVPGVRDCAVVVAQQEDRPHLVGFYCSSAPLEPAWLRKQLANALPEYMLPAALHWQPALPLTANGKIDKKSLATLAVSLDGAEQRRTEPTTPLEHRLADAWATVLGMPVEQVGRWDNFFDRGGTSLSAVKLAITLDRAVSLKDITRHPVLADLASLIDGSEQVTAAEGSS